jgi:phage terminase large subunit-like protein
MYVPIQWHIRHIRHIMTDKSHDYVKFARLKANVRRLNWQHQCISLTLPQRP